MEIPLKSQPKVSTVNLIADPKLSETTPPPESGGPQSNLSANLLKVRKGKSIAMTSPNKIQSTDAGNLNDRISAELAHYKLTRRYSETEKNNFDSETGHRLYDDGKIRPHIPRNDFSYRQDIYDLNRHNTFSSLMQESNSRNQTQSPTKIYSRSHDEAMDDSNDGVIGLEDEYIPGLNFADMIYRWNKNISDHNLSNINEPHNQVYNFKHNQASTNSSTTTSLTNTPQSRDASYLDLNQLHAQVAPQPIRLGNQNQQSKYSFTKLHDYMKQRNQTGSGKGREDSLNTSNLVNESTATLISSEESKSKDDEFDGDPKKKKQKSIVNPETGDINYEWIINSLPQNFNDLPYSQRKKLVRSFSESIDYSQFSLFAKNYLSDRPGSSTSSGRTPKSGGIGSNNGSFVRRPRMNSFNTIAGKLLARTSTSDLKKLHELQPKKNVDEKGAIVMEHELGKVIGFGAWGTIRECTDRHGTVRAIKIVKSVRDFDGSPSPRSQSPSRADVNNLKHKNPKVLEVFKKEIAIWKQLHHDNILPLLKHLETENAIFCITNRIYGGTLFELVSSWGQFNSGIMNTTGPLEFSIERQHERLLEVIHCTRQIVKALMYMHEEKGIVHGDLKLENVLVEQDENKKHKMIICDFGMARAYTSRLSRKSSARYLPNHNGINQSMLDEESLMMRSKSSNTEIRKPYHGGDTDSTLKLDLQSKDDSRIGISHFLKVHGPSLQSIDLTPTQSSLGQWREFDFKRKSTPENQDGIDSDLPHSHIGSLPYASPELLSPSPPPLGPSADIWALGVLMYTMCVGKLPFQHQYEPRLRAIIFAGKYNREDLKKACLLEWIFQEKIEHSEQTEEVLPASLMIQSPSLIDLQRQRELVQLQQSWADRKDKQEFQWLYDIISGCLEKNITKRWDLDMISQCLDDHPHVGE
ncbi:Ca2+/calmodulin-dependent protein kinase [Scheffersomyces xylosifermentans]|uniref:Ca2+/calmodulin-dependent protein kinase n=1 Tax=Scheffersomyces xylosifermentans TaxID=1304137 RepID=UPI00315CDF3C